MKLRLFITLICCHLAIGCSMVQKVAVSSTADIMQTGSGEINTEANWDFFQQAAPANLKMIEGLWFASPENEELLTLLIKGYGGFAFSVNETLYLEDKLQDIDQSHHLNNAIWNYTKAFDYGVKFLENKGIKFSELIKNQSHQELKKLLQNNLSSKDKIALFYFAQSWGGIINLQRTNVDLLANFGVVKIIMDWVCEDNMDFEYGSCHLFYAVYEASRPAMLGGSIEKGKKIFLNMMKKYPENLLARVNYIQYILIPLMDDVAYVKESEFLKKEFHLWNESRNLGQRNRGNKKYIDHKHFNLFNATAEKRFSIIEKYKNDIF